jgi:hypothetical protein
MFAEFAIGIIGSLLIRWPLIGKWGNSDEAWYAAIAAHNVAYGKSPFECPGNNLSPTIAVYQLLTTIGHSYHKLPLDVLTLLICAGVAVWVYRIVRAECGGWSALLAAAGFLVCQSLWEGGTSNREWFAVPFLLGSVHLLCHTASGARSREAMGLWRIFVAGLAIAMACGMKEQSLPFLIVGPSLFLFLKRYGLANWRMLFQSNALYAMGFMFGLALILSPHLYWGTLSAYLQDFSNRVAVEGGQNMLPAGQRWMALLRTYGPGLILSTEGRSVILAFAALSAVYYLGTAVLRLQPIKSETRLVLTIAYVASVICVAGGGRFFDHYYLFLLPLAVPMITMAVVDALDRKGRGAVLGCSFLLLSLTQSVWGVFRGVSADCRDVAVALGCSFVVFAVYGCVSRLAKKVPVFLHGLSSGRGLIITTFFVSLAILLGHRQFLSIPASDLAVTGHTASLCRAMDALRQDGDEIFVWGWQTRIYPATRMVPASQFVSTARVVRDFSRNQYLPELIPATSEMHQLLKELDANRPRFLVDASRRTYSLSDPRIYDMKRHSEMQRWVKSNYQIEGSFDDFVLYVRR